MSMFATIFSDFNLPNATTWFYFSLLLVVALFFKFSRLLSVRNLDLVLVFLPVPGLLLLLEGGLGKSSHEQVKVGMKKEEVEKLFGKGAPKEGAPNKFVWK